MRASRIEGVGGGSKGMTIGSGRPASTKKGSSKKAVKTAIKNAKKAKPLAEPKSAVKVKSPAKTKGNPYDNTKSLEGLFSSVSRGGEGSLGGKSKTARTFMSKNPSASGKASRPAATPANPDFKPRVKIDTNPLKTSGFSNLKRKIAALDTPANRARAMARAKALKAANAGSKKKK